MQISNKFCTSIISEALVFTISQLQHLDGWPFKSILLCLHENWNLVSTSCVQEVIILRL